MRILWSPTARRQVQAAVAEISEDRPNAALTWLDGLMSRIELLAHMPEQGRVDPEWGEDHVRELLYEPFRIVYEVHDDRIEVLVLSHFRQEFPEGRA